MIRSQGTRSLNGCWTCRLRRKKCDETHPSCSICDGLGLVCAGYGPRPAWMNGGEAEKEQATRVKRLIKNNKRSRKELRPVISEQIDLPDLSLGQLTPSPTASSTSCIQTNSQDMSNENGSTWMFDEHDFSCVQTNSQDMSNENGSTWMFDEHNISCDFPSMDLDTGFLGSSIDGTTGNHSPFETDLFHLNEKPLEEMTQAHLPLTVHVNSNTTQHSPMNSETEETRVTSSTFAGSGSNPQYISTLSASHRNDFSGDTQETSPRDHLNKQQNETSKIAEHERPQVQEQTFLGSSILNIGQGPNEAKWFMHYLDRVFYVIFPFYNSSGDEPCRSWILNLLMRDKSIYYAALALGQCHFHYSHNLSVELGVKVNQNREGEEYYSLALRDLQDAVMQTSTLDRSKCLIRRLQAIACSLHLIFYEILHGATGPWQMHLRTAAPLVSELATSLIAQGPRETTVWDNEIILSSEDRTARSLILGALMWFDILAGASNGCRPLLAIDQVSLLEDHGIGAKAISGCENWVLSSIFKISELSAWKKDAQAKQILSVAELARRGSRIETELAARLETMRISDATDSNAQARRMQSSHLTDSRVSSIFGQAALTYLHVTVSGANYQLPEIIESVSKTVEAFAGLEDAESLRHLVWPFCVSACMASGEQQEFFRRLGATIHKQDRILGAGKEALKIAEECWKSRESSRNFDWMSAMSSLGNCMILS